ncbi:hypothetical protein [Actinomadura sp. 3N407]|uniref:hypothetical protein n=1 Tax=Actinomadura sp. 3N407 TaxID=3457423 RepID=UPI003FCD850D
MLFVAVSFGAFIFVFAITRQVLMAAGCAVLAFIGLIAFAGFQSEKRQAEDREERGKVTASVPAEFVGTWSGEVDSKSDPMEMLLSVEQGKQGDRVAVVRITSLKEECVATGRVKEAYERRVLLESKRMKGSPHCSDLRLDLTGDKNQISVDPKFGDTVVLSRTKAVTHRTPVSAVTGTWAGTYQCSGKPTGLKLTIRKGDDGELKSLFESSPVPGNPDRPYSSFEQTGLLYNGHLTLDPDQWVDEPEGGGYVRVALSADVTEARPSRIKGRILTRDCTTFTLRRR